MARKLDTDVSIETPEHVVFQVRLAGPMQRIGARLLDWMFSMVVALVALVAVLAIVALVTALFGGGLDGEGVGAVFSGMSAGFALIVLFALEWLYGVVFEAWKGGTPGKLVLGLRVTTTTGRPVGLRAAAIRNLLRAADWLPVGYVLGLLFAGLSGRFQRLGDFAAGTMVISLSPPRRFSPIVLTPPARPDELALLPSHLVLDVDERSALELFLRRRGALGFAREHELALLLLPSLFARKRLDVRAFEARRIDPARALALVYDRAVRGNGADDAVPSSRFPSFGVRKAPG